jgi:hypothetical protein
MEKNGVTQAFLTRRLFNGVTKRCRGFREVLNLPQIASHLMPIVAQLIDKVPIETLREFLSLA